ncbi:MAG TPA: glycosyltransferase family 1 protein [Novosphingobium sp.]|nr:glycosyltransferase family 1 protein [Novosphingobium sp.]
MSLQGIAINGKFLGAPLNGVHRTAAHFSEQLVRRAASAYPVRVLAPRPAKVHPEFPQMQVEVEPGSFGSGQGWEWFTLPSKARGSLLVNFCNLAPLAHGNSVVMIHDAQTFLYPEDYGGRQAVAYRRLLPWIARRARRILTVSGFARDSLAAHGVGTLDKIDVVHNGTDHILAAAEDRGVLRRNGLGPGGYVLTVGSTKGYKNIRTVFEALRASLPGGHRLVVAGGPGEACYRKAGLSPPAGTVFTGFVSDAELRALYAGAAVFVFPSLTEGFGLPPLEAMQCGAPVVAARAGAMPEVCGDGALFVEPTDARAYRKAIEALLACPEIADALRARGSARARRLSWDAAGERLYDVIGRLL